MSVTISIPFSMLPYIENHATALPATLHSLPRLKNSAISPQPTDFGVRLAPRLLRRQIQRRDCNEHRIKLPNLRSRTPR
jgi:hypothetical protein